MTTEQNVEGATGGAAGMLGCMKSRLHEAEAHRATSPTLRTLAAFLVVYGPLLTACDKVVAEVGGQPRIEERRVNCTHTGFCVTCMPGFYGEMNCGAKLSPHCPGRKNALVEVTPITTTYESGKVSRAERTRILEVLGACS